MTKQEKIEKLIKDQEAENKKTNAKVAKMEKQVEAKKAKNLYKSQTQRLKADQILNGVKKPHHVGRNLAVLGVAALATAGFVKGEESGVNKKIADGIEAGYNYVVDGLNDIFNPDIHVNIVLPTNPNPVEVPTETTTPVEEPTTEPQSKRKDNDVMLGDIYSLNNGQKFYIGEDYKKISNCPYGYVGSSKNPVNADYMISAFKLIGANGYSIQDKNLYNGVNSLIDLKAKADNMGIKYSDVAVLFSNANQDALTDAGRVNNSKGWTMVGEISGTAKDSILGDDYDPEM